MTDLLVGELFAGVGALGLAVAREFNAQPAWFAEVDAAPSKVLAHRFPHVPNFGDVTKVDFRTVPHTHIRTGGFPCQDVSTAGRMAGMGDGTRSGLWSEFRRSIQEDRPDWVVIENVRGLLSTRAVGDVEPCPWCLGDDAHEHAMRALGAVLADLAALGFDAEWTGIRASDVGAPHARFRVFILAWPRERTSPNDDCAGLGSVGRPGGIVERDIDGRDREGQTSGNLTMLPTPDAYERGGSQDPAKRREGGHQVSLADVTERALLGTPRTAQGVQNDLRDPAVIANPRGRLEDQIALLPTPTVGSSNPAAHGQISGDFRAAMDRVMSEVTLMPTPRATRGGSATEMSYAMGGERSDTERPQGVVTPGADWGPYATAIQRWEQVIGRPAPAPVRMDGKGERARLNPELTEWMMGWDDGWVTDPAISLTRPEQLKACGNGVVTLQAQYALRILLARPGVPAIRAAREVVAA